MASMPWELSFEEYASHLGRIPGCAGMGWRELLLVESETRKHNPGSLWALQPYLRNARAYISIVRAVEIDEAIGAGHSLPASIMAEALADAREFLPPGDDRRGFPHLFEAEAQGRPERAKEAS